MYIRIKWIKGKPYKYQQKSIWDKKKKVSRTKHIKYLGIATDRDLIRYYKGVKGKGAKQNG